MTYFSDKELTPPQPTKIVIAEQAWGGLFALIESKVDKGWFGKDFPEICQETTEIIGTNKKNFGLALRGDIPKLGWPFCPQELPHTSDILDLLEFCHRHIAQATELQHHKIFGHHHLHFDRESGRSQFRERVNQILARNEIAYELSENGTIRRILPQEFYGLLKEPLPATREASLKKLLDNAREKFLNSDPAIRRESLEKLWDGWEKLKTLELPEDK
ncbi:MAG: hypothetical protein RLZZ303_2956, partial [Candidatus Hydrogenedentota bacterium]